MAEQVAPDALILNLTNPSSYVQYAIRRYTSMSVLGICDTPATLTRLIAQVLDLPHSEMEFDYVGMHHAGWVVAVRHLGEDVLPRLMERPDALSALEIDPQVIRAVGAVPSRYFKYYFHPDRMLAKQERTAARTEELIRIHAEMLAHYAQGDAHMQADVYTRRGAAWYGMVIVPVLLNLTRNGGERFILNVDNGSTIPWLPCESIVEVPCVVSASGAHAMAVGSVPADIMAFVQANCTYEMLAVQAIVEQSCDLALRALLLNPMLRTVGQARRVLDRVWPGSRDE
jgi:6-phospho-beta-glucosidase